MNLYDALKESVLECGSNLALSGGLDSSIIAYFLRERRPNCTTIITDDFVASDLTYCQIVAKDLDLPLTIKYVSIEKIFDAIHDTIKILKNFNDIEIRNSVTMCLIIKDLERGDSLITGDGADELFLGYNFLLKKSPEQLEREQIRIWDKMHFTSQKIGDHFGIKVESPFLNSTVIRLAKSIPVLEKVRERDGVMYGKWILRKLFEDKIPKIAWRVKVAMQDGSGTSGLKHFFDSVISDEQFVIQKKKAEKEGIKLRSRESAHYYSVYRKFFDVPELGSNPCPYCKSEMDGMFCQMCGAYPV